MNKHVDDLSKEEKQLVQMAFGLLTDMVDNQILGFSLTQRILLRKFPKLLHSVEKKP